MDPRVAHLFQQEAGSYVRPPHPRHAHSLPFFPFSSPADGGSEEVSDLRSASLDPHHSFADQGKITCSGMILFSSKLPKGSFHFCLEMQNRNS